MTSPLLVDRLIARVLLWGGIVSVALVLGGLALYAWQGHPASRETVRVMRNREAGRPVDVFTSLDDVERGLVRRPIDPLAITTLGLLCLLATPPIGVAVAVAAFWRDGDRDYATIAVIVLGLLLVGFALAGVG